jgi:hypothetical protein
MAGIDPYTGEKIYYPGENRSKRDRIMNGSSLHGGGLLDVIGPLLMIIGGGIFFFAILSQ